MGWRREGNEDEEQEKEKREECETLKRTEGGEPPEGVQSFLVLVISQSGATRPGSLPGTLVQVKTWSLVHFPGPWSTSKWTKDRT